MKEAMPNLFALSEEYRHAAQTLADLDIPAEVVSDTLESISGAMEEKAQSVAYIVRALEADAAAANEWAKAAADRAKAIGARAASLRDYLANCMTACGITKIDGPGVALSFRKSSAVVIDEPELIPAEFMRQPEPPPAAPDKKAIGDAIKAGAAVPGARIEVRSNLQIK